MTTADPTAPKNEMTSSLGSRILPSLHIVALSSLAVAQPLLDLLRKNPEFFVARDLGVLEISLLLTSLLFVLPIPLLALEAAAALAGERARVLTHRGLIWALFALIALPFLKRSSLLDAGWITVLLAAVVALLATWGAERLRPARMLLDYLSVAPLLVALVFLLDPQIGRVLRQTGESSAALPSTGASAPIVFVILDELAVNGLLASPGEINRHRYPNFAALASESVWFENAATVSSQTVRAVPAILTGRIPDPAKLATVDDHPVNLFTFFGSDYDIWADETVTKLCPPELNRRLVEDEQEGRASMLLSDLVLVWEHLVLPSSYAAFLPPVSDNWENFGRRRGKVKGGGATGVRRRLGGLPEFELFLDSFTADAERTLRFVHLSLPHHPWVYLPSGKEYRDDFDNIPGLDPDNIWGADEWYTTDAYRRYLLQLEMVDRLIGRLVRKMKDLGTYDSSLIVIVSDHGISFRPGDRIRRITLANRKDILPMLMLVKKPYQSEPLVVRTPVLGIDLFPTILDVLGIDPPADVEGRSALDPSFQPGPARAYFRIPASVEEGLVTRRPAGFDRFAEHDYEHAELHQAKHEMLDWKLRVFGGLTAPSDIFRVGTHPELHGRRTADLAVEEARESSVFVANADLYEKLDPEAPISPSRIFGTVNSDLARTTCSDLAIAVNGRIEATTRAFHRGKLCNRFSALVPESVLHAGANTLDVLVISKDAERLVLRRPRRDSTGNTVSLAGDGTLEKVSVDGSRFDVNHEPRYRGNVTSMRQEDGRVYLSGWAWDRKEEVEPEIVLLFLGTELVASTPAQHPRGGSVAGKRKRRPFFHLGLSAAEIPEVHDPEVRVVALSTAAGVAWEIPLRQSYRRYERRRQKAMERAAYAEGTAK